MGLEVLPNLEFAFGNLNVYGKAEVFVRIGHHLDSTFLPRGVIGEGGGLQSGRVYADGLGVFCVCGYWRGLCVEKYGD
ncbi:hypothetical protein BBW65_07750 [Helicobacter enhydrae]|uniref:Uncharacterized protein n=1 Tax=Helicobacter enhydrae TaxID=222136 RepID=A0A1B1U7P3_9HELI|nr:hypothetical protein [Helicobacter enhydrae]ANV98695.1 hypothetical protein BBW65_07750 [Helicobacter enhydrae]